MEKHQATTTIALLLLTVCAGQRVVPGVNPQHYQPPQYQHQQGPPPPQYQQQQHVAPGVAPQQYQQQATVQQQQQQFQQQPLQQQPQQQQPQQQQPQQQQPQQQQQHQQQPHQQQPHQQQPHQQQQHHQQPHGHEPQQVLNAANIQNERAHIQEHMQVPIDTSKMSEAELQFHYFKMHDSDNNNKLDGCELIKSLIHWHAADKDGQQQPNANGTGHKEGTVYTDQGLTDVIDYVLKTMDLNNDGYVDYAEYRKSEDGEQKGNSN